MHQVLGKGYRVVTAIASAIVIGGTSGCDVRSDILAGTVRDPGGQPVPSASVRLKAMPHAIRSDEAGRFRLAKLDPSFRTRVTAWKDGYYVGGADAWPWRREIEIILTPLPGADRSHYEWLQPAVERTPLQARATKIALDLAAAISFEHLFLPLSDRLDLGCQDCHGETVYREWAGSAHALGNRNPRFLSLYNGTDLAGNRGMETRYGHSRDYGAFPLRPVPNQPSYGPGYRLDFPKTRGNCAACHLPGAAVENPYGTDPNEVTGVDAQGVHCDFCHKISGVRLDLSTGRPRENLPGVLSIGLTRPEPPEQVFFGPYDDVDVGSDTYLPLIRESAVCAPCHQASFWGVPIYQSFAEWQESAYPAKGVSCQDCHMRPDGSTTNFAPGRGGVERDPETVATHRFPGAGDAPLLKGAVDLHTTVVRSEGRLRVQVAITNDRTGHHVPTDSPLRQLILLVEANGKDGSALPLVEGSTVPDWGGTGDPNAGCYAGLPGKGIAKILEDLWTGTKPTAAYWKPARIHSDNRIPAGATDRSLYVFSAPGEGAVEVNARLLYRRAFIDLMDQKGWDVPDILMAERSLVVRGPQKETPK